MECHTPNTHVTLCHQLLNFSHNFQLENYKNENLCFMRKFILTLCCVRRCLFSTLFLFTHLQGYRCGIYRFNWLRLLFHNEFIVHKFQILHLHIVGSCNDFAKHKWHVLGLTKQTQLEHFFH